MPINFAELNTELTTDPTTLGYATPRAAGNDQALTDALNLVRAAITIRRANIPVKDIWEAITVADMTALPGTPNATQLSTERRQLAWLSGLPAIGSVRLQNADGSDTSIMTNLAAIFPASGTRTRLLALASRTGSRAEQLFGVDTVVTTTDVARALRGL